jgi:hypothetical protein
VAAGNVEAAVLAIRPQLIDGVDGVGMAMSRGDKVFMVHIYGAAGTLTRQEMYIALASAALHVDGSKGREL